MSPRTIRRAIPAAVAVLAIVIAAVYVLPHAVPRRPFTETIVWSLFVATSFVGWGSLVAFVVAPEGRVDLGLRMAWGAGAFIAIGGWLIDLALLGRTEQTTLVELGVVLAIAAAVRERERIRFRALFLARFARREPRIFALLLVGLAVVALHYLIGISESHTNPYDDDIAYLPFVKELLQTGTFLEPFSFRRLSALGGQTLFVSLLRLRSAAPQSNTFDRSVCVLLITLLMSGYRNRGRRAPLVAIVIVMGMLFTLPLTAINTASYYSGVAFFLALFRTITWAGERELRAPWRNALPLSLVAATTMTLRQNYLPVPVIAFAMSYGFRLWKERNLRALAEPLWTAGLTIAFVLPWMVCSYQSNKTLLYPLMSGTFNRALALESTDWSFYREAKLNVWTFLEGVPSRALGFVVIAAACLRERATRRPLLTYAVAAAFAFLAVVHGLTGSDAGNIGRYVFGATLAFVLATVLAAGTERADPKRAQLALGIALVGCAVQMVEKVEYPVFKFYNHGFDRIEQLSHEPPSLEPRLEPPEFFLYGRLQASVPPGQRLAILLDEPYHLDYARNPIWNIDMPGYSSPAPGMPFFQGSEKVEAYFKQIGVRYLAYVRPEYSRYHYRRVYWLEVLVDELEMWRAFAPYLLDFLDSLEAMTQRHKVLFEERGLVVLDLESPK